MDELTPINSGRYEKARGWFDGITGFVDGLAGATDSFGRVVNAGTDIRDDLSASQALADATRLDREEREQDLLLDRLGFDRGDNRLTYGLMAAGAVVVLISILR